MKIEFTFIIWNDQSPCIDHIQETKQFFKLMRKGVDSRVFDQFTSGIGLQKLDVVAVIGIKSCSNLSQHKAYHADLASWPNRVYLDGSGGGGLTVQTAQSEPFGM